MFDLNDTVKRRFFVISAKPWIHKLLIKQDTGLRRHDGQRRMATFYNVVDFVQ